jgi:hypothetical protein
MAHTTSRRLLLLITPLALLSASCNAAIGAGAVVLLGGAGYLASQCYDRVRVRVYDRATGTTGCEASVFVSDGESERELRPCYNTALTEGKWTLIARRAGYVTASTEIVIPDHEGKCPSYTHTVEFTLRRDGDPAEPATVTPARTREPAGPAAPPSPGGDMDTPPSRVVPPPLPGVPTGRFEPVQPPGSAPAPAPAAPPAPAPAPQPAPAPTPAPPPAPAPAPPAPQP